MEYNLLDRIMDEDYYGTRQCRVPFARNEPRRAETVHQGRFEENCR